MNSRKFGQFLFYDKKWGSMAVMGGHFLLDPPLRGQIWSTPPKKKITRRTTTGERKQVFASN